MICPNCAHVDLKVVDSRPSEENSIRRRRECTACNRRFTTYESVETLPLMVRKKSGIRELFDKQKIMTGIMKSCSKCSINHEQIELIADDIETTLLNRMVHDCTSAEVGEMVMERLRDLDEVVYIRFASIYKSFRDVDSFMNELKTLRKIPKKIDIT